jgi:hypothetical protein
MGNEEQAVDFGNGARLAERAGKLDEQVDDLDFHRVQGRHSRTAGRQRFFCETDAHGASLAGSPICSIKNEQKIIPRGMAADFICRFTNIGQFMGFNPGMGNRV